MTNDYNQNKAIAALLRGETIPSAWMDELSKVKTLSLSGNQITDPSGLAALQGQLSEADVDELRSATMERIAELKKGN